MLGMQRILSITFLVIGLFLLGRDAASVMRGLPAPEALGALWYSLDPGSLNFTQAIVQRYLLPEIWDPGITTLLLLPAWALPIAIGLVLLVTDIFSQKRRG